VLSSSSALRMRSARTSTMRALVCESSVTIPACEPVSEIARWPRSLIAIAHSAHEMRSPVESSMSISRRSGSSETSRAIAISSSVVEPRAESTATTRVPSSRLSTMRRAARLMRSASETEVPPNFITTRPDIGLRILPSDGAPAGKRLAERDLVRVLEVGADGKPAGEPRDGDAGRTLAQLVGDVERGGLAGGGGVGREHDLAHGRRLRRGDTREQLGDLEVLGVDAVDRR